jgi:hypothetical protein
VDADGLALRAPERLLAAAPLRAPLPADWVLAAAPPARVVPCVLAPAWLPRVAPPYWFAVDRFAYGVPPRCWGLWLQFVFPPRLTFVFRLMFAFRLKLLLTLTLMLLLPQPQP